MTLLKKGRATVFFTAEDAEFAEIHRDLSSYAAASALPAVSQRLFSVESGMVSPVESHKIVPGDVS